MIEYDKLEQVLISNGYTLNGWRYEKTTSTIKHVANYDGQCIHLLGFYKADKHPDAIYDSGCLLDITVAEFETLINIFLKSGQFYI